MAPSQAPTPGREQTLLLGIDHPSYGDYALRTQRDGATACTLSAGSDPLALSRLFKARHDVHNEDALLAIEDGASTLVAVSDAHFGHEASHILITRLADELDPLPRGVLDLLRAVHNTVETAPADEYPSEATLVVALWDRAKREGYGVACGDSSLVLLGESGPRRVSARTSRFVSPRVAPSLDPRRLQEFEFTAAPGDLLVAFTDGVDECHYRNPQTSVTPSHLQQAWHASQGDPERFAARVTELALAGVDGHPGGQDNIALIASRA